MLRKPLATASRYFVRRYCNVSPDAQMSTKTMQNKLFNAYKIMGIISGTTIGGINCYHLAKYELSRNNASAALAAGLGIGGCSAVFSGIVWPLAVPCFAYDAYNENLMFAQ